MAVKEKEVLGTRKMERIEYVGLTVLGLSLAVLFFRPGVIGGIFDAMVNKTVPVIVKVYLTGTLGCAIILSVMTGRILERLGFTDALVRLYIPLARWIKITPLVIVPAIYNILGDINAAGRITAPYLKKVGATKDEQKIAVATMCQGNQSFSTLMLGILAFATGGIWAFPVIFIGLFLPVILVPLLLKVTLYRNVSFKDISDMPRFTPSTPIVPTIFNGAREGAELLFLLLIPAAAVIFAIMGALDYIGIWKPIENALTGFLGALSIDPQTGIQSILVSPTLAMNTLVQTIKNIPPRFAIGSFIIAASGFPLQIPLAQIPAVWSQNSDLTAQEALEAAVVGIIIRIISAFILAMIITPLVV
ncbi:hypothetical protein [Thermovenabulum gondwanense]|uniref:Nucleoside transporter/FeoB GTPase Gate domain-containing protein n=1 Tax=Thermovenabulum gondwanense TaxID=520767 RepID=A0A162MR20_9FIRM|nr:hypothetical protein [Thermovenabulum gondwanense]KYO66979.1 hypothetical protein ATZ99_07960 [Thermovenabulum gondwanense]